MVIETLSEGVLVVDGRSQVRSINPSARELIMPRARNIKLTPPFTLTEEASWQVLVDLARLTFFKGEAQGADVVVLHPGESGRRLRIKARLTGTDPTQTGNLCVMFLKDLPALEARLRQEKMLSMGRMSAAVAHEIRNPLAAITQANALLAEDLHNAAERRLSAMIAQNADRLARIVDDVLNLARVPPHAQALPCNPVALDESVQRIFEDWCQQNDTDQKAQLRLEADGVMVTFEPEHLRRVLINLLDNAARYSMENQDSIVVFTHGMPGHDSSLIVWSDGLAIEPTVQRHLFEPFFSSESRSSGLGLYICRELCEQHGAVLGYTREFAPYGSARLSSVPGNSFFVAFKFNDSANPVNRKLEGV
jgi:two-component system sensor histidine kinase PilS (NtrC family)